MKRLVTSHRLNLTVATTGGMIARSATAAAAPACAPYLVMGTIRACAPYLELHRTRCPGRAETLTAPKIDRRQRDKATKQNNAGALRYGGKKMKSAKKKNSRTRNRKRALGPLTADVHEGIVGWRCTLEEKQIQFPDRLDLLRRQEHLDAHGPHRQLQHQICLVREQSATHARLASIACDQQRPGA